VALTHVPDKSASAAYPDVFGGRVPLIFDSVLSMTAHIKAGRVRPIAATTPKRVATLPDLPTMAEAGLPGYSITLWIAVFGPAGMPAALTTRLNGEINKVLAMSEVREQMAAQGSEVTPGTPDMLLSAVKTDLKRMGEIVKRAMVKETEQGDVISIRPMMYLTLTYDHRIIDGVTGNAFLYRVRELVETGKFDLT
jgi:tripartite-type tricarboxylate transporter receptor subunit TctC